MMRHRLISRWGIALALLLFTTALRAQEHIVARIVDAQTGEPLPFASVYVNGNSSTISNVEGEFFVDAAPDDTLRFSYVGYRTRWIRAADVGPTVALKADSETLGQVTVLGTDFIVEQVYERLKKEQKRHKKEPCNFFYRQLTYNDNRCMAFLEAFFEGLSAIQVEELSLVTGRYVSVASSLTANPLNFYTFAQVPVFSKRKRPFYDEQLVPIHPRFHKAYDVASQAVSDGERTVYRVDFQPRDTACWAVKGSIYVDAETFQLLRFEGQGQRDIVKHKVRGIGWVMPIDYSFVVNYIDDNGFTEVESVYFTTHFNCLDLDYDTTGILYNVGERYVKGQGRMGFNDNLPWNIRKQGIDRKFWEDNEVVKRTPLEEEALEIFEHDNLIGVY